MKTLPVLFSQRDPKWSNQRLGTVNGTTIGGYGCYVTAMAMVADFFGHNVTPSSLDDTMTNSGLYVNGNLMVDANLQKVFPDCVLQEVDHYETTAADLNKLKDLMTSDVQIVILEVDFNPSTELLDTHFVVCVDCDGTNVTIADPWTGEIRTGTPYGPWKTTIQKFVVYKGIAKPDPTGADMYNGYDLNNKESMKVAVDVLVRVQQGEFVDKSKYDGDVKTLNEQLDALKGQIAALEGKLSAQPPIPAPLPAPKTFLDKILYWFR